MTAKIRLGTSAFTATGWNGTFYPAGLKSSNYLNFYSKKFDTVEVDSTFYRAPTMEAVNNWALQTPPGFVFSLKIPRVITHEKILQNCDAEFESFVDTAHILGEKLGPMVFQFPYFNRDVFTSGVEFMSRLKVFFKKLPRLGGYELAVEIRNKRWLTPRFIDLLRENNIALVLQDQSWMPGPTELFKKNFDPITSHFTCIRFLGNRKEIELQTKVWNRTIVDRSAELQTWVDVCEKIQKRGITQYAYFNNHYAGYAPASVELFRKLCEAKGIQTPLNITLPAIIEGTLFDVSKN